MSSLLNSCVRWVRESLLIDLPLQNCPISLFVLSHCFLVAPTVHRLFTAFWALVPSFRMSYPVVFDPSAPGVTKRAMIDYMQIHHPFVNISTTSKFDEIAQKVREAQPKCWFPLSLSYCSLVCSLELDDINTPFIVP